MRAFGVLFVCVAAYLCSACVPQHPPAPAQVAQPTLAEYVHTLGVYVGEPGAVHALEADVFGDLGPQVVACVEAITWRESNDTWSSYNRSGASGLTQLLGHADLAYSVTGSTDVMNPWTNLVTARALSNNGTRWSPWTPAPAPC